jgi:hypothetical protein
MFGHHDRTTAVQQVERQNAYDVEKETITACEGFGLAIKNIKLKQVTETRLEGETGGLIRTPTAR